MDRDDEKKYTLDLYTWVVINNLSYFNNNPELLRNSVNKIKYQLKDHPILSKFVEMFSTAFDFYEDHKEFPTIQWFEVNYAKTGIMQRRDDEFSLQLYEDWEKCLDAEIIKTKCASVISNHRVSPEALKELMNLSSKYIDTASGAPKITKSSLKTMYADYIKDYKGVYSGIKLLDDEIGVLGFKSLSVFGAPSGHGKSTFAISIAYNLAMAGYCVDYVSYEVPLQHMWFNLIAMESMSYGHPISAADLKEGTIKGDDVAVVDLIMESLLGKIKQAGGYINVVDKTTAPAGTYEEFKVQLERMATERVDGDTVFDRKADLVVIDNIDNFQVFKSSERDESTRVNNYIIDLDSFCKTYHNGDGCAFLLLTQLNRGGLQKLGRANRQEDGKEQSANIDYTVFAKFNALYEKSTCCLVGYADTLMRNRGVMNIYPVKVRNRGVPEEPVQVSADYEHSRIGGQAKGPDKSVNSHLTEFQNQVDTGLTLSDNIDYFDEDDLDGML